MKNVLFICLGNICRSPMAEAIFRDLLAKRGLAEGVRVDSAGTSSWHEGERPHKGTLEKLAAHGISTAGMYSRPLVKEDATRFDVFVCMDVQNVQDAKKIVGDVPMTTLLDNQDVPDPYYTGDFEETYQLCVQGCKKLLEIL
jgi:protein-tyrosine phosphatase